MKTLEVAIEERNEAMARVEAAANEEWKSAVAQIIRKFASFHIPFSSDDIMDTAAGLPISTNDPRALGPLMTRAAKDCAIKKTGRMILSRRRHASPITEWVGL